MILFFRISTCFYLNIRTNFKEYSPLQKLITPDIKENAPFYYFGKKPVEVCKNIILSRIHCDFHIKEIFIKNSNTFDKVFAIFRIFKHMIKFSLSIKCQFLFKKWTYVYVCVFKTYINSFLKTKHKQSFRGETNYIITYKLRFNVHNNKQGQTNMFVNNSLSNVHIYAVDKNKII